MVFDPGQPEILEEFRYGHLPPHMAAVSKSFCDLAFSITGMLPDCEQRQVALHYLLLAKDGAVRAAKRQAF